MPILLLFNCSTPTECFPLLANHKAITKTLHSISSKKNVDILRSQACRDASTLLDYIPSYKGNFKRREKKEGEPSEKEGTRQEGRNKKKGKQPRVKFMTFKKLVFFWLGKKQGTVLPGIDVPLQTIMPEFPEEMSRRNTMRVNLRGNVPALPSRTDPVEPQEKRQKVTHDFFLTKPPTPGTSEKERPEASTVGGSKRAPKSVGPVGRPRGVGVGYTPCLNRVTEARLDPLAERHSEGGAVIPQILIQNSIWAPPCSLSAMWLGRLSEPQF